MAFESENRKETRRLRFVYGCDICRLFTPNVTGDVSLQLIHEELTSGAALVLSLAFALKVEVSLRERERERDREKEGVEYEIKLQLKVT